MKTLYFKGTFLALALSLMNTGWLQAQNFSESFDDITTLAANGWVMTNASVAVGTTNWFQGNPISGGGPFDSFNGATNAYIAANYNNTGSTGTISNWLMTPNRVFKNGDVITFQTRKVAPDSYADRLEVRMSTNGASTAVGTGTGVGDYTTLLLSVNPTLVLGVYPTAWTQYTITISGLTAPTSGRIAFRYFVTGAGFSGTASDYIGIDQIDYTEYVCPSFTMTAAGALTDGEAGTAYSTTLTQTGALGAPTFAVTAGALPPGLTLSTAGTISGTPTANGTFNFTVTVNDNSGCSGSASYSITTICGPNTTTLTGLPTLCSNSAPVALTQGAPAGGTYSGTGVTGGIFDPAAGSQTIQYDYTDAYGCSYNANALITVNAEPTVTLSPLSAVCDNAGMVTLGGESPTGGTFSGTGVSAGMFDPASGTQAITYTYTDGNGCSNDAVETITVNAAPVVAFSLPTTTLCVNSSSITLSGGTPAGGTYTGTGVSGNVFDPATSGTGTFVITYEVVDGNGCSDNATQSILVDPCLSIEEYSNVEITVAPNPSNGSFVLTGIDLNKLSNFVVQDLNGRAVTTSVQTINASQISITLNEESAGMYLFTGWYNDQVIRLRLLKN